LYVSVANVNIQTYTRC